MFHHSRQMETIEPVDFLTHQKMPNQMLLQNLEEAHASKRQRTDNQSSGYNHSPAVFFPTIDATPSVVVSKSEYETMKQEIANLKQTIGEFRTSVDGEINQFKKENKQLKTQVAKCTCGSRSKADHGEHLADRSSEDDSNFGKPGENFRHLCASLL